MESIPDTPDTDPLERSAPRRTKRRWRVTIERGVARGRVPRTAISRALARVGVGEKAGGEVRVVVLDSRRMRRLNRRFRKRDRATDVLAFPSGPAFPIDDNLLGEVYCNLDHARTWTRSRGGTLSAEMARLAVHGCLHLLGYRHRTPEEHRAMMARENRYLREAGLLAVRARGETNDAA